MLVKLYRLATTSQPGSRGRRHYYSDKPVTLGRLSLGLPEKEKHHV